VSTQANPTTALQPLMNRADWISKDELLQLTGWNERTIRKKRANRELRDRVIDTGRNGKPRREYDASSLPPELQAKRLKRRITNDASPAVARDQAIRTLASLDDEAREQAKQRLDTIAPLITFASTGQKPLCGKEITSLSGIVKHLAASLGHSERTLWNWWNAYKQGGPGALADRPRKDRNISRFFAEQSEAAAFASNKFLNERLSMTMVHEALLREWPRLRLRGNDIAPTYKTTRLFLRNLPPIITAVAHYGERAYKEDFASFLLRDRSKLRANQYWVSDHMLHDVWVRNFDLETGGPVFGEMPLNTAFRPWLTAIEDMKSRRIIGMVWSANPSSNTISSALRFALEHYGRPESAFYVDNGKDYNKVSDDARGVLTRLGISTQHCTPRHPQAKQIESFFHILHQRFDVMWRPAYAGTSPRTRPEECDRLLYEHKRLLTSGKGNSSMLPAASMFIQLAAQWLDDFNSTFQDKARGMGMRTPAQIFDADLPPHKRALVKPADMAQLFWDRQRRVVREGGTVQLFNARYEPADADSRAALMLNVKREVVIACDPLSVGEAIALTLDDTFLGVLRAQELLVHGETPKEKITAELRERRNVFKAIKHYNGVLAQSRLAAGDLSEVEVLARRATARNAPKPLIHALPMPVAVNAQPQRRMHADDIADSFLEEN
jgi:putative transposase